MRASVADGLTARSRPGRQRTGNRPLRKPTKWTVDNDGSELWCSASWHDSINGYFLQQSAQGCEPSLKHESNPEDLLEIAGRIVSWHLPNCR